MKFRYAFPFLIFCLCGKAMQAQDNSRVQLGGYVSYMYTGMSLGDTADLMSQHLLHNRLNFKYKPNVRVDMVLQARQRLVYSSAESDAAIYGTDPGLADLSANVISGDHLVLNTALDRAYLKYLGGKYDFTVGRQRINWSQAFVWNPNDVFNSYSFFDVDYPERPGSDALYFQYYFDATSSFDMAVAADARGRLTAAARWLFSVRGYDIQLVTGVMDGFDYVSGAGWSGRIGPFDFRGEMSCFFPLDKAKAQRSQAAAFTLNYTFDNSLFILAEYYYQSRYDTENLFNLQASAIGSAVSFSAKNLSFTDHNVFFQAAYPVAPVVNSGFSGIWYPRPHGFFVGPSVDVSLGDNVAMSLIAQIFGTEMYLGGQKLWFRADLVYFRLKANF